MFVQLTDTISILYSCDTQEKEKEVSKLMSDLRKLQSALKKAIDRKNQALASKKTHEQLQVASSPDPLPMEFINSAAQEIKKEVAI